MHIVQLYSGQNISRGDFVYRIEQPARELAKLPGVSIDNVDLLELPDLSGLLEAPLLILHHVTDVDLLPVVRSRNRRGLPTVYELADHFLASRDHKPESRVHGPPEYHWVMAELMRRCHGVQTTGPALAAHYRQFNRNAFIFSNLIQAISSKAGQGRDSSEVTIGWGGSFRHLTDLAFCRPALMSWLRDHPGTRLAIMGAPEVHALFNGLTPRQLIVKPGGSLVEYLDFLEELDIGLAPLLPTEFNACRSDVKYLEYASREVTPVCSRFGPYIDLGTEWQNIVLFDDPDDLIRKLERLASDSKLRKKVATQARRWVERNRLTSRRGWLERARVYAEFIGETPGTEISLRLSRESRVKNILQKGLAARNLMDSLAAFREAVGLAPENYQTHYFCGWALARSGQYQQAITELRRALRLAPASLRTAQLLARIYILHEDFPAALEILEAALQVEPGLPLLLSAKSTVLQLLNRFEEAFALLGECVGQEPALAEAELAYATLAMHLGEQAEAKRAVARLQNLVPDNPQFLELTRRLRSTLKRVERMEAWTQ